MISKFALLALLTSCPLTASSGVRGQRRSLQGGEGPPDGGGGMGGGGGGMGGTTCSDNLAPPFGRNPSNGTCLDAFEIGVTYSYPEGFGDVLNEVEIYTCPESDSRVIVSNAIPDHTLTQNNPNRPCEQFYMLSLPLNPTLIENKTEPAALGIIAMSLNGVPVFGAQEGGGTSAVGANETAGGVPWYGHAARRGDWHYHSGEFGRYETIGEVPSTELIGYAMDGFPIYGPIDDTSLLDECNGIGDTSETYRYHVRTKSEVDASLEYCDGTSPAVNWKYTLGCYHGDLTKSTVADSKTTALPADCVVEVPTSAPVESSSSSSSGSMKGSKKGRGKSKGKRMGNKGRKSKNRN